MREVSERERLKLFIQKFMRSSKGKNDYIELLLAFNRGCHMSWDDIESIYIEVKRSEENK
jgi:hypothetical protein